ncbi:hypothetical protein GCM10009547_48610 [Sporichthya brevicatena]|uniref:Transposase IS30-like HTH domain-containing protein n=1 Tax=Sporichthya brevicatena TaxID=171442 RepID=A0ABP3SM64_9ACTN
MVNYGEKMRELRAERANEARRLRNQGLSLRQIAAELNVDHTTVALDLRGDMNTWMRDQATRRNHPTRHAAELLGLTPTPENDED